MRVVIRVARRPCADSCFFATSADESGDYNVAGLRAQARQEREVPKLPGPPCILRRQTVNRAGAAGSSKRDRSLKRRCAQRQSSNRAVIRYAPLELLLVELGRSSIWGGHASWYLAADCSMMRPRNSHLSLKFFLLRPLMWFFLVSQIKT
jgi:hypothetical protein